MSAVTGPDFVSTARFIRESLAHVESLRQCQRHDGAEQVLSGLRRLADTIRATQADHGFIASLVLGNELEAISNAG